MTNRVLGHNFETRSSLQFGDRIGVMNACYHQYTLVDEGERLHLWVSRNMPIDEINDHHLAFKFEGRRTLGIESYSWDYIPDVSQTSQT